MRHPRSIATTVLALLVVVGAGCSSSGGSSQATTTTAGAATTLTSTAPVTSATSTAASSTAPPTTSPTTAPTTATTTPPTTATSVPPTTTAGLHGAATPGDAAQALYAAWKAGDQVKAATVADPAAVTTIFERAYTGPDLQFMGCQPDGAVYACGYYYEGGARSFRVKGSAQAGYRVFAINDVAD